MKRVSLRDRAGLDVQLVGEVVSDQRRRLARRVIVLPRGRLASAADTGDACSAPASASARMRPPDDVLARPSRARRIAWAKPLRVKRPCGTTPEPPQSEQIGAAVCLRVDLLAKPAQGAPQQAPPSFARERGHRGVPDRPEHRLRDALHQLERDVSGEAVGDDRRPPPRRRRRLPRRCRRTRSASIADAGTPRELRVGLSTSALPRPASSPFDSRPTRGRRRRAPPAQRRAHERELDQVLAVAPRRSRRRRAASPGARGRAAGSRAPGGRCRGARLMLNVPRPAPRRSPPAHTSACALPSATALAACTIEASGVAARRAPGRRSWRSTPARRRPRTPAAGAPSSPAGPNRTTRAPWLRRDRGARRNLGRAQVGAVAVDRHHRRPRSVPRGSRRATHWLLVGRARDRGSCAPGATTVRPA